MTDALSLKVVERFHEAIDKEDAKAADKMSSGLCETFDEYRRASGYRKAIRDAKTLINEILEDIMKE